MNDNSNKGGATGLSFDEIVAARRARVNTGPSELATQANTDLFGSKAEQLQRAKNAKEARFTSDELAMNLEQFRNAYPNATSEMETHWLNEQKLQHQIKRDTSDIWQDIAVGVTDAAQRMVSDTVALGVSAVTSPIDTITQMRTGLPDLVNYGSTLLGQGNIFDIPPQEESPQSTGLGENALSQAGDDLASDIRAGSKMFSDFLKGYKSDTGLARDERREAQAAEYERRQRATLNENSTDAERAQVERNIIANQIKHADMADVVPTAAEAISYMFGATGFAKAGSKIATKGINKEIKDATLQGTTKEAKEALLKRRTKAQDRGNLAGSTVGVGAMEGGSNASESFNTVMATDVETLRSNPEFVALEEEHGSDRAKELFAQQQARISSGTAVTAGLANVLTGGVAEKALSKTQKGLVGRATAPVASGITEAPEEFMQSAASALDSNRLSQEITGEDKGLEGVSRQATEGAMAGALGGAATGPVLGAAATTASAVKAVAETPAKIKAYKETKKAEREAAEAQKEAESLERVVPKESPIVAETPTVEAYTASEEIVKDIRAQLDDHTTEDEAVNQIIDSIKAAEEGFQADPVEEENVVMSVLRASQVSKINEGVETLIDDQLAREDISEADATVLKGIKKEFAQGNLDSLSGSVAKLVEESPEAKQVMDEVFTAVTTGDVETAEKHTANLTPEQAQDFYNAMLHAKLYSGNPIEDENFGSEDAKKAAEASTGSVSEEWNKVYRAKKMAEVSEEVETGTDSELFKGIQTHARDYIKAVKDNAPEQQERTLKRLEGFLGHRALKATAIEEGIKEVEAGKVEEFTYQIDGVDHQGFGKEVVYKVDPLTGEEQKFFVHKTALGEARKVANTVRAEGKRTQEVLSQVLDGSFVETGTPTQPQGSNVPKVQLPQKNKHWEKDQKKSDQANKFIGKGVSGSSTAAYAEAWGDRANTGTYTADDKVFVSINGGTSDNRKSAIKATMHEVVKAIDADATIITDIEADRQRNYNTGERTLATFLKRNGYQEDNGVWTPAETFEYTSKKEGKKLPIRVMDETPNGELAYTNNRTGRITIRKGVTREEFQDYVKGGAEVESSKQKQEVQKNMDEQGYPLDYLMEVLKTDKDIRRFIIEHEIGHTEQREEAGSPKEFLEAYKADPIQFELDANLRALKALGIAPKDGKAGASNLAPTQEQAYLEQHAEKVNQRNLAQEKEQAERAEAESIANWEAENTRLQEELAKVEARLARNPNNTMAAQRKLDLSSQLASHARTDMKTYVIGNTVQAEDLAYSPDSIYPAVKQLRSTVESLVDTLQGRNLLKAVAKLTGVNLPKDTNAATYTTATLQADIKRAMGSLDKTELIDLISIIQDKATTKADKVALKEWQDSQSAKAYNSAQVVQETVESLNVIPLQSKDVDPTYTYGEGVTEEHRVTENLFKTGLQKFRQSKLWQAKDMLTELSGLTKIPNVTIDLVKAALEGLGFNPRSFSRSDWMQIQRLEKKRAWFNAQMDKLAQGVKAREEGVYTSGKNEGKKKANDPLSSNRNVLRDLMVQDENGNWTFPPRIKDAAFLAYYSLGSQVSSTRYNDDVSLQGILGENSNQKVRANPDYEFMKSAGTPISQDKAVKAFREMFGAEMKPTAPQSTLDGISTAMGVSLLSVLDQDPEFTSYNTTNLTRAYGRIYMFATPENNNYVQGLGKEANIKKYGKGSSFNLFTAPHYKGLPAAKGIIGQVAKADYQNKTLFIGEAPLPITKGARTQNGRDILDDKIIEAENISRSTEYKFSDVFMSATANLFKDVEEFILFNKGKSEAEIETMNVNLRGGQRGIRLMLQDTYERHQQALEQSKELKSTSVYLTHGYASQRRMVNTSGWNPLGNKYDRGATEASKVDMLIDLENPFADENNLDHRFFLLVLAQHLEGVNDSIDVDKQENQISLNEAKEAYFAKWLPLAKKLTKFMDKDGNFNKPVEPEVMAELKEMVGGNPEGQIAIFTLAKGVSLRYEDAGLNQFSHSLRLEVDGLTNGPFHSIALTGLTNKTPEEVVTVLKKGGWLRGSDAESIGIHKDIGKKGDPTVQDNYLTVKEITDKNIAEILADPEVDEATKEKIQIIAKKATILDYNDGEVTILRNGTKNPVTVTVYGGGESGIHAGMFVGAGQGVKGLRTVFYEDLTAIANGTYKEGDIKSDLTDWAKILSVKPQVLIGMMNNPKALLEYTIPEERWIRSTISKTVGKATTDAINEVFADNKHTSSLMNLLINFSADVANNMFRKAYEGLLAQRIEEGVLKPHQTLSSADLRTIQKAVEKALPFISTAISQSDTTNVAKKSKEPITGKVTRVASPSLGKAGQEIDRINSATGYDSAGVAAIPVLTISVDANTQAIYRQLVGSHGVFLNLLDAMDILAGKDARAHSEIANLAEYMSVMEANQIQSVIDSATESLAAIDEGILVEGKVYKSDFTVAKELNLYADELRLTDEQMKADDNLSNQTFGMNDDMVALAFAEDAPALVQYALNQLQINKARQDAAVDEFIFGGNGVTQMNQMGGIDNGGVRIENGVPKLTEEAKALLGESQLEMVEEFSKRMEDRGLTWKITDALQEEVPENIELAEDAFGSVDGSIWDGLKGSFSYDSNTSSYTLEGSNLNSFKFALQRGLNLIEGTQYNTVDKVLDFFKSAPKTSMPDGSKGKAWVLEVTDGLPTGINGELDITTRTIKVRKGITQKQAATVLGHELTHILTKEAIAKEAIKHVMNGGSAIVQEMLDQYARFSKYNKEVTPESKALEQYFNAYLNASNNPQALGTFLMEWTAYASNELSTHEFFNGELPTDSKGVNPVMRILGRVVYAVQKAIKKLTGVTFTERTLVQTFVSHFSNVTPNITFSENTGQKLYSGYSTQPVETFVDISNRERMNPAKRARLAQHTKKITSWLTKSQHSTNQEVLDLIDMAIDTANTKQHFSGLANAGFKLDDSEELVFNYLVATFKKGQSEKWLKFKEATKLYNAAKSQLSPESFLTGGIKPTDAGYAEAMATATLAYNAIFKSKAKDAVINFMALAEVDDSFSELLKKVRVSEKTEVDGSFLDKVKAVIEDWINKILRVTSGMSEGTVSSQLKELSTQLTRATELAITKQSNREKTLTARANNSIKSAVAKAVDLGLAQTRYKGKFRSDNIIQSFDELRRTSVGEKGKRRSQVMGIVEDFAPRDHTDSENIDRHARRSKAELDNIRMGKHADLAEGINSNFTRDLKEDESVTLLEAVQVDLSTVSIEDAELYFSDNVAREKAIEELRAKVAVSDTKQRNFLMNEAKSLGLRMVLGGSVKHSLNLPNAKAIAKKSVDLFNGSEVDVESLDKLITLYGISNMSEASRTRMSNLFKDETKGVEYTIKAHTGIHSKLKRRLGARAEMGLIKGYVPAHTDSNKGIRVVPRSELSNYPKWEVIREVKSEPLDTRKQNLVLIANSEGGHASWVGGAASTIEATLSGFSVHSGKSTDKGLLYYSGSALQRKMVQREERIAKKAAGKERTPTLQQDGLLPNVNALGQIIGFRQAMTKAETSRLLEESQNAADVLGRFAGRIWAEAISEKLNTELSEELFRAYTEADVSEEKMFVKVYAGSSDPVVAETWKIIPPHMKKQLSKRFGGNFLYVHRNDFDNALGFREFTGTKMLNPNVDESTLSMVVESVLGEGYMEKLRKAERLLQEAVVELKDFIVIRSVIVPFGNLVSNWVQLMSRGLGPLESARMIAHTAAAVKEYKAVRAELRQVEQEIDVTGATEALMSKRKELQEALEANPEHVLISQEGFLSGIVEDLEHSGSHFKQDLLDKYTPEILKGDNIVINTGKFLLLTKDSSSYRFMSDLMEMGDYIGKSIAYKQNIKAGMSHEKAVAKAAREFIDYGALNNQTLDYINKMGLGFFFKYFMRSQAVMANMLRENPSRTFMTWVGADTLGMDNIFNANIFEKDLTNTTGLLDLIDMGLGAHPLAL